MNVYDEYGKRHRTIPPDPEELARVEASRKEHAKQVRRLENARKHPEKYVGWSKREICLGRRDS